MLNIPKKIRLRLSYEWFYKHVAIGHHEQSNSQHKQDRLISIKVKKPSY